jgi:hypothetical protein
MFLLFVLLLVLLLLSINMDNSFEKTHRLGAVELSIGSLWFLFFEDTQESFLVSSHLTSFNDICVEWFSWHNVFIVFYRIIEVFTVLFISVLVIFVVTKGHEDLMWWFTVFNMDIESFI